MKLFFVSHVDADGGENHDWFVVADDRSEAVAEWQDETGFDCEPEQIFLVPVDPHAALLKQGTRTLSWHTEVELA